MNLPDIVKPVLEMKVKNSKRYPCYVNRASGLGYAVPVLEGCLRRGVYERTKWEEKELPDERLLVIFGEGNLHEKAIMADLAAAGIQIIEQQGAFEWKEYQISGHIDGALIVEGKAVPVEIKSSAPSSFDAIHCFEDLKKKSWLRSYMCQISLYMLFKNIDQGIMLFKNKSTGQLKQINVQLDYELAEACIKAAETINKHIADKTLPDRITNRETCRDCPFKLTCLPEINFGTELKIADDPEFEKRINRWAELKDAETECEEAWKVIRSRAEATATKGELKMLIGKWQLSGKADSRGAFRLKVEAV